MFCRCRQPNLQLKTKSYIYLGEHTSHFWQRNFQAGGESRSSKGQGVKGYAATQNKKRTAVIPGHSKLPE